MRSTTIAIAVEYQCTEMKATLLTAVILTALASLNDAADPECVYRKIRGLSLHWPNPSSCDSYYKCSAKSTVRTVTCPAGKEYNPKNGKCSTAGRGLCKLTLAAPLAETSNVCSEEVTGAYLAKTGYCSEFYICDNQLAYPQICTAGSYFNATTGNCLPDTETECWQNQCIGQPDGKFLADSTSCGQYYICLNDEATQQECDSGSYFNTTLGGCVEDQDNTHCWVNYCIGKDNGWTIADKENCEAYYVCLNNAAVKQECPEGSYFNGEGCVPGTCPDDSTTTTTTTTPATGCDCSDGSKNGQLVADKDNCRKYYVCDNGVLKPGDCLKGNYFNSTLEVCQADTENICPDSSAPDCDCDGQLIEDTENCNKYYICKDGEWQSETCPTGEYFDTTCGNCAPDTDNVCPQCDSSDNGGNSESSTTEKPDESDESTECIASDKPYRADNCWTYYACISGKWQKESCVADSYFDASLAICRQDESNSHCPENRSLKKDKKRSRRSVGQEDEIPDENPESVCCEGSMQAHPTECAKYLICTNQTLVEGSCGQGNLFSSSQDVCVPDIDETCWLCRTRPNGYQVPDPTDCTAYFTCSDGLAIANKCSSGEWYNGESCEIDVSARCINPCSCVTTGTTAPHPICTKYFECADGVAQKVVSCPAGQGFDAATGVCSSSVDCPAIQCATAENGVAYPVVGDTTKFYVCLDLVPHIESCPENKEFNTEWSICLPLPSSQCDQSKCTNANQNAVYATNSPDPSNNFCLCQSDGAYLESCPSGYVFDNELETCGFTGPCDPQACVDTLKYSASVNFDDPNGFCLCRAGQPVPVDCPIGYTFNNATLLCVLAPQPDPRCCRNYCKGKPDNLPFEALNTDTGFCLCSNEVPLFEECPQDMTYDSTLGICLENNECEANECDPLLCLAALEDEVFPIADSPSNYCYCENFCPIYGSCPEGTTLDEKLLICLGPERCNATECSSRVDYEPFLPEDQATDGFCYCVDNHAFFESCPKDYEFNVEEGICLEVDVNAIYCDSEKCSCLVDDDTFPSTNCNDPSSFCYCQGGNAIYDTCGGRKVYDADLGLCLIPEAPDTVCTRGKCATLPENDVYPTLNDPSSYCLCVEGVAVLEECPTGYQFSDVYLICLEAAKTRDLKCDARECSKRVGLTTFAARNTTSGYCTCQSDGTANYLSCLDEHVYDVDLKSCIVNACDPMQCRIRTQFEAFAARNTSKGFCSCDITPTFNHCSLGHVFDEAIGACVEEVTVLDSACDPLECQKRALFEPFASKKIVDGFCSCDGEAGTVRFHKCSTGMSFDSNLGMCIDKPHTIQKRSIEPEEKFSCKVNEKRSIPANCSQYEICLDGNWRKRTCSEDRYYNPELQRCMEPRDDMVCGYARVTGLPACDKDNESETIANGRERGNNCLQYFRCSAGKWRLRTCPKLHYYLPSVGTCLPMPRYEGKDFCGWINGSESISSEPCQTLSVRPSPMGCSFFLMCTETGWWTQQCPLGMYFSRELNYCIHNDANQCDLAAPAANSSSCIEGEKRSVLSSCQSYEECLQGEWRKRSCNRWEQYEPLLGCILNDGSCQGNGLRRACNARDLRAIPEADNNCSQIFYYCEADEWHLGSCLRGQSFVRELGKCQSLEKCQTLLSSGSGSCVGQPDGQSVAHPDDCARFYVCLQEQPALLQNCAPGSYFNAALGYCRPNDGSCQRADSICATNATAALIPHSHNCHAYYNCTARPVGAQLLSYCPKGQYFDQSIAQCRLDQGQCSGQATLNHSEVSLSLCSGLEHGTQLPHKQYCNLYYVCVRSLAILAECPNRDEHFSIPAGECVTEQEQSGQRQRCQRGQLVELAGSGAAASCANLSDGNYVPDYRDCTKYYICAGGVALPQRCALGSYFDAEQLLCRPDDGICPNAIRIAGANDTNADSSDRVNMLQPNPSICEGKHGYITADTANCNNFYICVSNKLRADRCYSGYFFNATLNQCQSKNLTETEPQRENGTAVEHDVAVCTDEPTQFANLCRVIGEGASLALPGDCRRYISCDEDEPISQRCRNGESYDYLLGICRQNDGTCLMENGERVGVCNKKHGQLARDIDNCRRYFVCVHGQRIEAECQAGYYFSRTTNTCQEDLLQQCVSNVAGSDE